MPIVVNGTTIPENVANVLNVNGTNITSVVCDGTTVWTQNLNLAWSGDMIANPNPGRGIETSGNLFRTSLNDTDKSVWATAYVDGTFSSTAAMAGTVLFYGFYSGTLAGSPNALKICPNSTLATTAVTYTKGVGFTGSSSVQSTIYSITATEEFLTAGGCIRYHFVNSYGIDAYSSWATLS